MYSFFKRCFDFILSFILIILLFIPMLIIAFIIKSESNGDVFFKQKRIGKDKKEFFIYKFRTMKSSAPKNMPTHLFNNPESFITKTGAFLRKSGLDELPQLFNILKGEMSFVGPRPALWNQYDLIEERDKYNANSVRPGLTGLAQVSGRDELPIEVKAKFDGEYIKKQGLIFDLKIFFMTFSTVVSLKGYKEGSCAADKENYIELNK